MKRMQTNHRKRKRAPRRTRAQTLAAAQPVGTCKRVRGKGGCTIELCKTGKGLTGWEFQKDSRRCAGRKA